MSFCKKLCIIFLSLLLACGTFSGKKHKAVGPSNTSSNLPAQYEFYRQLHLDARGPHGWSYAFDCDGLLFSSLSAIGAQAEFEVEAAEGEYGQFFRKPLDYGSCYDEQGDGGSDISRDMLVGLIAYAAYANRLDILERLWDYGQDHDWKMGRDRKADTRTIMTPHLVSHLARIIEALGGKSHPESYLPLSYATDPGFVSHLTLIQVWTFGHTHGYVTDQQLDALKTIAGHSPNNALAQALLHKYTDGNQQLASQLLSTWPADHLPTNADWCEEWRTQRADGDSGLSPCDGDRTHSGGDFLFAAGVVLDYF